jgi:hypothetical protein
MEISGELLDRQTTQRDDQQASSSVLKAVFPAQLVATCDSGFSAQGMRVPGVVGEASIR